MDGDQKVCRFREPGSPADGTIGDHGKAEIGPLAHRKRSVRQILKTTSRTKEDLADVNR